MTIFPMPRRFPAARLRWGLALGVLLAGAAPASAVEIKGSLAASLDQPRVNAALVRPGDSTPLTATAKDITGQPTRTFNIQAFFDTGASGVLISTDTADALGLNTEPGVTFQDVGVGGTGLFDVSEPINLRIAPFSPDADIDNPATFQRVYSQSYSNLHTQVGPRGGSSNPLLAGTDVIGTPAFAGKTVVMDNRPVNAVTGTMVTHVYDHGAVPASVPKADYTVPLSFGNFAPYTQTTPKGATGPTLNHNPFIGPAPLTPGAAADTSGGGPGSEAGGGVRASLGGKQVTGSWLLDTGATASIISTANADALGITYNGTFGTDHPTLYHRDAQGKLTRLDDQFLLPLGGIGGTVNTAGFYLDTLAIPTNQGEDIDYKHAPVLVSDISVQNPDSGDTITLDGVFGMNFLTASASISGGLPSDLHAGAYEFVTYDETTNTLGLVLTPEPTSAALLGAAGLLLAARRRHHP